MKKILLSSLAVLGLSVAIITVSCKDKNNNNITPTYRTQAGGASGGNPCLQCVTVTGTTTPTDPATQNSSCWVGGSGWSYNACSTAPNTLTGFNGSTQVQLVFGGGPIIAGTYALTSGIPTAGQARMTVNNAPGQPDGIVWYSKTGGSVITTTTAVNTTATFNNIQCTQASPYIFPVVSVSGTLTCS